MSDRTLRLMRNAALVYVGLALVVTLLTFTWLVLSPGELFPDQYADPSVANTHDKQVFLLWVWWVLVPGVAFAVVAALSADAINTRVREAANEAERQRWREQQEADRQRWKDLPFDKEDRLASTGAALLAAQASAQASKCYPNDERTHTIALRYNNLRSLA